MNDNKLMNLTNSIVALHKSKSVQDIEQAFNDNNLGLEFDNDERLQMFYNEDDFNALYMQSDAWLTSELKAMLP